MNQKLIYLFSLLLFIFLYAGCDNEDEPIPAFVYIDQAMFENENAECLAGTTHGITHMRMTVNGLFAGFFELPVEVPVLSTGETAIVLTAGVRINASMSQQQPYEFYLPFQVTRNLVPNTTDTIHPVFTYRSNQDIDCEAESFDDGRHPFTRDENNQNSNALKIETDPAIALEGNSAYISVDTSDLVVGVISESDYFIRDRGTAVYIEFDYKSNVTTQVSLLAFGLSGQEDTPVINLLPTDEWTKVYFQLNEVVQLTQQRFADRYRLYLGAALANTTASEGRSYFDNVKLIYTAQN